MFVDSGVPRLFRAVSGLGGDSSRYVVKVAGGAKMMDAKDIFSIGHRNDQKLKEVLDRAGYAVHVRDVGGLSYRTMRMSMANGQVTIPVTRQSPVHLMTAAEWIAKARGVVPSSESANRILGLLGRPSVSNDEIVKAIRCDGGTHGQSVAGLQFPPDGTPSEGVVRRSGPSGARAPRSVPPGDGDFVLRGDVGAHPGFRHGGEGIPASVPGHGGGGRGGDGERALERRRNSHGVHRGVASGHR
jgi:hypothetical protein